MRRPLPPAPGRGPSPKHRVSVLGCSLLLLSVLAPAYGTGPSSAPPDRAGVAPETAPSDAANRWQVTARIKFIEEGKMPWSFDDDVIMHVPFSIDEAGRVLGEDGGLGGHEVSVAAKHKDLAVRNLKAPDFEAAASGQLKDGVLHIKVRPKKLLELSFDIYGGDQYKVFSYHVAHYGVNEWGLIEKYVEAKLPLREGETTDGLAEFGYEEFGDSRLRYSYAVWINTDNPKEDPSAAQ